jgi:glucose/arabinose dehydrogenase
MSERSCESHGYRALVGWPKLPAGVSWSEVAGVATDSRDHVFVFSRGEHRLLVFDTDGTFMSTWDHLQFVRPHGIFIGPDDAVYLSDDEDHTVRKYTPEG